jgi:hypothetical protein
MPGLAEERRPKVPHSPCRSAVGKARVRTLEGQPAGLRGGALLSPPVSVQVIWRVSAFPTRLALPPGSTVLRPCFLRSSGVRCRPQVGEVVGLVESLTCSAPPHQLEMEVLLNSRRRVYQNSVEWSGAATLVLRSYEIDRARTGMSGLPPHTGNRTYKRWREFAG